jgi:hypothetical protein
MGLVGCKNCKGLVIMMATQNTLRTSILASAVAAALTCAATADFVALTSSASLVDQSSWAGSDAQTLYVISVYAEFDNVADKLIAVYGDSTNTLSVSTSDTAGFYQFDENGGGVPGSYNSSNDLTAGTLALFESAASDSFVTIGLTSATDNAMLDIGIVYTSFNDGSATSALAVDNGTWFITPSDTQGTAGNYSDNRVLVGQFTVGEGHTITGSMSLQWTDSAGVTQNTLASNFSGEASGANANHANQFDDFDGNFHGDILWQHNSTGSLACWHFSLDGSSNLTFSSHVVYAGTIADWTVVGYGDFDGNGTTDYMWQHTSGSLSIWYMSVDGSGNPVYSSKSAYSGTIADYTIVGFGDFDGNGTQDLLWQHTASGSLAIWYMSVDGSGNPVFSSKVAYSGTIASYSIAGYGDFDGSGTQDILWQHDATGSLAAWYMSVDGSGNPVYDSRTVYSGSIATYSIVGFGDFDGSGTSDILWQHDTAGSLAIWYMSVDGSGNPVLSSKTAYSGSISDWSIVQYSDYDATGTIDILWQHDASGSLVTWLMSVDGSGNPISVATQVYSGTISAYSIINGE